MKLNSLYLTPILLVLFINDKSECQFGNWLGSSGGRSSGRDESDGGGGGSKSKWWQGAQSFANAASLAAAFTKFKSDFGRNYFQGEEFRRFGIFKQAFELITKINGKGLPFQLGINQFADLTPDEILDQHTGLAKEQDDDDPDYLEDAEARRRRRRKRAAAVAADDDDDDNDDDSGDDVNVNSAQNDKPMTMPDGIPRSWDWREYGILTPVRNQGKCGSCWSFSSTCGLESHTMKKLIQDGKFDPNKQLELSEQFLIDCSGSEGTAGCNGGMPQQAWRYVLKNKTIAKRPPYPYKGKKHKKCQFKQEENAPEVHVQDTKRLPTGDDNTLLEAIYKHGPVSVAVQVDKTMSMYKGGIFENPDCDPKMINHAVVAVGYGEEKNGQKYFIVRNSWGDKWGENGYIRISRNQPNHCGISQQAYYPVIKDAKETPDILDKLNKFKKKND